MTLALRMPEIVHNIISVDNAPVDAALLSGFGKYIQGMKKIEDAHITRQAEADAILKDENSLLRSDNSFLATSIGQRMRRAKSSKFL